MRVVDVKATLALPQWRKRWLRAVNLATDLAVVDLGSFEPGTVPGGVAVASWRWDVQHARDGKRVSSAHVSGLLRKCNAQQIHFLAIDAISVDQTDRANLMANLIAFSSLYDVAPVVTQYGPIDGAGSSALCRAWVLSELGTFGSRARMRDIFDFGGPLGMHSPRALMHTRAALQQLDITVLDPCSQSLMVIPFMIMIFVFLLLQVPYSLFVDVVMLVRFQGFSGRSSFSSLDKARRAEAFNRWMRGPMRFWGALCARGPAEVILLFTWLLGINSMALSRFLSQPLHVPAETVLNVVLIRCHYEPEAAMFFGDLLHVAANLLRAINQEQALRTDRAVGELVNHMFAACYGQALSRGHHSCVACRLRALVVLVIMSSCAKVIAGAGGASLGSVQDSIAQGGMMYNIETVQTKRDAGLALRIAWKTYAQGRGGTADSGSRLSDKARVPLDVFGMPGAVFDEDGETKIMRVSFTQHAQHLVHLHEVQPDGTLLPMVKPDGSPFVVQQDVPLALRFQETVSQAVAAIQSCQCNNNAIA